MYVALSLTAPFPVQIVAVDPIGSILAEPEHLNEGGEGYPYQVGVHVLISVCVCVCVCVCCLLYTSPSPRDATLSRMPSSA